MGACRAVHIKFRSHPVRLPKITITNIKISLPERKGRVMNNNMTGIQAKVDK